MTGHFPSSLILLPWCQSFSDQIPRVCLDVAVYIQGSAGRASGTNQLVRGDAFAASWQLGQKPQ